MAIKVTRAGPRGTHCQSGWPQYGHNLYNKGLFDSMKRTARLPPHIVLNAQIPPLAGKIATGAQKIKIDRVLFRV